MDQDIKKEPSDESSVGNIASAGAIVKQTADIDGFITKRQEFIQKVNAICVEGKDFHVIQGKKSLAKGGAEKIASIFQWNASFDKDDDALSMLGEIAGLVAYRCTIRKGTKYVGEGRGAALLKSNAGDPNKTLKMAQKSAFIDAVLRASGLSDFFTQDLEDMPSANVSTYPKPNEQVAPGSSNPQPTGSQKIPVFEEPSKAQIDLIKKLKEQKGYSTEMLVKNLNLGISRVDKFIASKVIDYLIKAPNLLEGEVAEVPNGK